MHGTFFLLAFFLLTTAGCMQTPPIPIGGYLDGEQEITLIYDRSLHDLPLLQSLFVVDDTGNQINLLRISPTEDPQVFRIQTVDTLSIKSDYYLQKGEARQRLIRRWIYRDPKYFDLETPLGAVYHPRETTFRLFAPRADSVYLRLYPSVNAPKPDLDIPLDYIGRGIWETSVAGNLHGVYYTFVVKNPRQPAVEIVDPYARLTSRGDETAQEPFSESHTRWNARGRVVDLRQTGQVAPYQGPPFHKQDAIIYEVHTRDMTIHPESEVLAFHRGLFQGFVESSAIRKLTDLGINVVQLLPVNEFLQRDEETTRTRFIDYGPDSDGWYRWGYMPIQYFSPEGWYASSSHSMDKIRDFKALVSALHRRGIRVVLDVVLNHTAEGNATQGTIYAFKAIDPDYYYRTAPDGSFYNGIGVGNELFSEMPMVSRFIQDVLTYWVDAYDVDGFRMDWMSATDPHTLAAISKKLHERKPDILLYGELWTLREQTYHEGGKGYVDRQHVGLFEKDFQLPPGSIAGFNDYFRDAVKGSGFGRDYAGGYIQDRTDERYYGDHLPYELMPFVISGMLLERPPNFAPDEWAALQSPLNVINYVAVHDGYTLWDKLIIAEYMGYRPPGKVKPHYPYSKDKPTVVDFNDPEDFPQGNPEARLRQYDRFAAAILLTSQGIPFLHAGQEMLRQKIDYHYYLPGDSSFYYFFQSNSYNRPDAVNALRWKQRERYSDIYNYYRGLIAMRRAHPTFRRPTAESVQKGLHFRPDWRPPGAERAIAYELIDTPDDGIEDTWKRVAVLLNPYHTPQTFRLGPGRWHIAVTDTVAGTEAIGTAMEEVTVPSSSLMVLFQTP